MKTTLALIFPIIALFLAPTASAAKPVWSVEDSIHAAAGALSGLVQPSGQFTYQVSLDGKKLKPDYNTLHHAGAIYYLGEYLRAFPKDPRNQVVRDAILKSTRFLAERSIGPVSENGHVLQAVFSIPELVAEKIHRDAMLGSSGLGVLALLASENIKPGSVDSKLIRAVGDFLLYLQKPDGSFYIGYLPEDGGRKVPNQIILYPGEAILGLTALYRWDHDHKWLRAAKKALMYLARKGSRSRDLYLDNWAVKASAELWKIPGALSPSDRKTVLQYAARVCQADLLWRTEDQTTLIAVRLEGLSAALEFLPQSLPGMRRMLRARADQDAQFLLGAQVRNGPYKGMFTGRPGGDFVQIDIIWHALSGLLTYRQISSP